VNNNQSPLANEVQIPSVIDETTNENDIIPVLLPFDTVMVDEAIPSSPPVTHQLNSDPTGILKNNNQNSVNDTTTNAAILKSVLDTLNGTTNTGAKKSRINERFRLQ